MCRNIKTLFNFEPPVTEEEVRAASLQFVRKISGYRQPSKGNAEAFNQAVEEIARASRRLLEAISTVDPDPTHAHPYIPPHLRMVGSGS